MFLIFVNRVSRGTLLQKLWLQTSAAVRFLPPHWGGARLFHRPDRSRGQGRRVQNEQGDARARNDCVGPPIVVAEFDKGGSSVERLDDAANLATDEHVLWQVAEKRDGAQQRRVASFRFDCHLSPKRSDESGC